MEHSFLFFFLVGTFYLYVALRWGFFLELIIFLSAYLEVSRQEPARKRDEEIERDRET
jgi:hypothetical protein